MKAVVKYARGIGNVDYREVPEPFPRPDEVKIEVKNAGICGSDIHIYREDIRLLTRPPFIMGHEFSGVVAEVGSDVSKYKIGDRVTSETAFEVCGQCLQCRTGEYNICAEKKLIGYWFNGAFTRYVVVPSRLVHRLPSNVTFLAGALCEPLACCVNGVLDKCLILPGDVVAIAGPGTIGLLSLQLAKSEGAFAVLFGTSIDEKRLEIGKQLGADVVVNVQDQDPLEFVAELTDEKGIDAFIECSGSAAAIRMGTQLLRRGGHYSQIGLVGKNIDLDFDTITYKELTVRGSLGQRWSFWNRGLRLLSEGKVKAEPLVSDILPLSKWDVGFRKMETKEGLKIVLEPE